MRLTYRQKRRLDDLFTKDTRFRSLSSNDRRSGDIICESLERFLYKISNPMGPNRKKLHLLQWNITVDSKELFTEVVKICFPGENFTLQVHSAGRDRVKPTDTQDYSGAAAFVFTLPTRTIRFYTRLWTRNPNFTPLHFWWVAQDLETANPYADSDDDPLSRTDDNSQPEMSLIYTILETLHTRLARLETAGVKA
jgi:hypothetical protein